MLDQAARLVIKYNLLLVKKKDRVMPPGRKITRDDWMAMRRAPKALKKAKHAAAPRHLVGSNATTPR